MRKAEILNTNDDNEANKEEENKDISGDNKGMRMSDLEMRQ